MDQRNSHEMGAFNTSCRIQHIVDRRQIVDLPQLLVDTGSEHTWIPEKTLESLGVDREKKDLTFVMANGQRVTRSVGYAIVHVEGHVTVDEVVFAEAGDLLLLGARTLEGLNLTVDPARKKLVAAGPLPAAALQSFAATTKGGSAGLTRRAGAGVGPTGWPRAHTRSMLNPPMSGRQT